MVVIKLFRQGISYFLLIVLSVSIIPAESFHHHEDAFTVCHDELEHIEEKSFECELSDYTFPVFLEEDQIELGSRETVDTVLQTAIICLLDKSDYQIPNYRGPPVLLLL